MKFAVGLFLLAVYCHAADVKPSRSKQKDDSSRTDKRALAEGNAGLEKRAPVIATALPSVTPGIVYADTNQLQEDKSPRQEVYATPLPQLTKISDLLAGQGHHFQAAIASHLFSPVSVYQTRLPGYEVSAPVPAKLAYTEKITYQPQSAEQYTPQVFKQPQKQANFIRVSYPQPVEQYQQIQPQQLQQVNQYQQLQVPQIQPVHQFQQHERQLQPQFIQVQPYQSSPSLAFNQPFQYQGPAQFSAQPIAYIQQQLPANEQPGIVYAREEENNQRPVQTELKAAQPLQNVQEKPEQSYNTQNQGAVSFASFSVGPPVAQPQQQHQQYQSQSQLVQYQPQPQIQYRPQQQIQYQPQQQIQYQPQPQIQYQSQQQYPIQPQQNQAQQQYQLQPQQNQAQQQYQLQSQQAEAQQKQNQVQHQYQIQRQPLPRFTQQVKTLQYQAQPIQQQQVHQQIIQKPEPSAANSINLPSKPVPLTSGKEQLTFYRADPNLYQPHVYQGQEVVVSNQLAAQQALAVPTFPPVQFFGKYAQELFRSYQQH